MIKHNKKNFLIAAFCGFVFIFSFPPHGLAPVTPLVLAAMIGLAFREKPARVFLLWFLFGFVFNAYTLHWAGNVVKGEITLQVKAAVLTGVAALSLYMSLYQAVCGWLLSRFRTRYGKGLALTAFPFLWTGLEYLRSLGQISFPWTTVGYTAGVYNSFMQFSSVAGVYFYSLLICAFGSAVYTSTAVSRKRGALYGAFLIALCVFMLIYGFAEKKRTARNIDESEAVKAGLVQTNVDLNVKWNPEFLYRVIDSNISLSRSILPKNPDMIIWAESAVPCWFNLRRKVRDRIRDFVNESGTDLYFGSLRYEMADKPEFYTSMMLARPQDRRIQDYDKIKLVPFSEYLPFENYFPVLSRVDLGEADFSFGKRMKLFETGKVLAAPFICYEIIYPSHVRKFVNKGANLIINISNDGWFGDSDMPHHHFNMAKFRAVENRRTVIRATNTGISAIILPDGTASHQTPLFEAAAYTGDAPLFTEETVFSKAGDAAGVLAFIILIISLPAVFLKTPVS
ncbi:MAG: apolipoprotein N-acyltransferase [Fibrobacterota bacterium]